MTSLSEFIKVLSAVVLAIFCLMFIANDIHSETHDSSESFGSRTLNTFNHTKQAYNQSLASSGPLWLAELTPGSSLYAVTKRLERAGITANYRLTDMFVYEAFIYDTVHLRQRLVLAYEEDVLLKAGIVIDFSEVGGANGERQTFHQILNLLLRRYGRPVFNYERGNFGVDLAKKVNTDQFVRLFEWELPNGELRFGIPRRLDRKVRMEIHFADKFPPAGDTLWGFNAVF